MKNYLYTQMLSLVIVTLVFCIEVILIVVGVIDGDTTTTVISALMAAVMFTYIKRKLMIAGVVYKKLFDCFELLVKYNPRAADDFVQEFNEEIRNATNK